MAGRGAPHAGSSAKHSLEWACFAVANKKAFHVFPSETLLSSEMLHQSSGGLRTLLEVMRLPSRKTRTSPWLSYRCGLHHKVNVEKARTQKGRAELHRPWGHELSLMGHISRLMGSLKVRDVIGEGLRFLYTISRHSC